ncbi:MAG TPA: hypothetical protein VFO07_08680 [Roseiflexaceae bacterium]|nr:hypothetical protein [Roseiflexaceae bacterium]
MLSSQDIADAIKERANTIALGLLLASLLAIYLATGGSFNVTILGVVLLALGLYIAVDGGWGDLLVLVVFSALVSIVAAYIVSQARFGTIGAVLIPLLWTILVFLVLRRLLRGIRPVPLDPESPAILISRGADRRPYIAPPPVVVPFLQRIVAIIPRKTLIEEFDVDNINVEPGHNVDKIVVHVRYRIVDPVEAYRHASQTTLDEAARKTGKGLAEARLDVTFWERLFEDHLLNIDVAKAVREVAFEQAAGAVVLYRNRVKLAGYVLERLNLLVRDWGAEAELVELDFFKVDGERFRLADPERRRAIELAEATHLAAMEATRLRQVLGSEVEAEAQRVKAIIDALRQSNVEITPDVVIRAIRAASDWTMDGEYSLQPYTAPTTLPPPAPKK